MQVNSPAQPNASQAPPALPDPGTQLWEQFLADLENSFSSDETGGSHSGECARTWHAELTNLGNEWVAVMNQEATGAISHQAAAGVRQRLTNSMKAAGDTYMRCLNQPLRKRPTPNAGG